jgi:hypothetical protein
VAGDFDYETGGVGYGLHRQTDQRIAALVVAGLGDAGTVVNIGAGAGSYEPADCMVTAVEPSEAMRSQRRVQSAALVSAVAEALPFRDGAFDAAMASVTVHQWGDTDRGLADMRRVTSGPVVVLTFDGDAMDCFWLVDYVPELIEAERQRFPGIRHICETLGGTATVVPVPVAIDCVDGFIEAFYGRPESLLEPAVRRSQSAWAFVDEAVVARGIGGLRADLETGEWDRRYGHLRTQAEFVGSLRLITSRLN